jgi:hypothetical protein
MPDLSEQELVERLRMLEDQVYPDTADPAPVKEPTELDQWEEEADGTLDGPALSTGQPENIAGTLADDAPLISGPTDGSSGWALLMQNADDLGSAGDRYATIGQYTSGDANSGTPERFFLFSGDVQDEEVSLYTKADAVGSGDSEPVKRIDIDAGSAQTEVAVESYTSSAKLSLNPATQSGGGSVSYIDWRDEFSTQIRQYFNPGSGTSGQFFWYDAVNGATFMKYDIADATLRLENTPIARLREISNPTEFDLDLGEWAWDSTNDRWLFRDSSGTAHFFNPDGSL